MEKEENLAYVRPRPMSKTELAMLYCPNLTPASARNRIMGWLNRSPEFMERLRQTNYETGQRVLTSRQVRMIFEYLGPP